MIKTEIFVPVKYTGEDIRSALTEHIPVKACELGDISILKRKLILSDKSDIKYKMTVGISLGEDREAGLLKMKKKVSPVEDYTFTAPPSKLTARPIVVGSGPAGLFAALVLAEAGARPIVLERGMAVDERIKKVELFNSLGVLDPECNIQFGEGGAGTFSDGKLKYGAMDSLKMKVLSEFVLAGAESEILYSDTAHLGTDKLRIIVKNIREKIISLGGEFIFSAKLTKLGIKDGQIRSVIYEKDGEETELPSEKVILAIGHSARDTFEMLFDKAVSMVQRPFGIGLRIEHPREYINKLVYGEAPPDGLEAASYHLVTHLPSGRSVYSFCMCPGGTVVGAASLDGGIVTNGMSEFNRDAENSNAAFLVSVTPDDFPDGTPLSGFALQKSIEERAYGITSSYKAPAIRMADFLEKSRPVSLGSVKPSYPLGVELCSPEEYLPDYVAAALRSAIPNFDEWMGGFKFGDAVMTGPETRTTSPVRILRDENLNSVSVKGLYPAGEGAGYAGGIVSSAVDGIRCALALLKS